jgi:hypothetical protein
MRQEIKKARRSGNHSRAAMLELDIADPNHPQVLLRRGVFNNRGLGGVNQNAYFNYLKDYTEQQNKKRDLTSEEQVWFSESHLGEAYQTKMANFSAMELEMRKMLAEQPAPMRSADGKSVIPNPVTQELIKRLASLSSEKEAAEAQAQEFSRLYSQVDRGGQRSTVPRMSTQFLPAEAMLLPEFAPPSASSTGSGYSDLPFGKGDSRGVQGMTVAEAALALRTPSSGDRTRSDEVIKLVDALENDPNFGRQLLDHLKEKHFMSSEASNYKKKLKVSTEMAIALDYIVNKSASGDEVLRERLLSGIGYNG